MSLDEARCPHARGGVPKVFTGRGSVSCKLSPRSWGCAGFVLLLIAALFQVVPTLVGVCPLADLVDHAIFHRCPHARGGVPELVKELCHVEL